MNTGPGRWRFLHVTPCDLCCREEYFSSTVWAQIGGLYDVAPYHDDIIILPLCSTLHLSRLFLSGRGMTLLEARLITALMGTRHPTSV